MCPFASLGPGWSSRFRRGRRDRLIGREVKDAPEGINGIVREAIAIRVESGYMTTTVSVCVRSGAGPMLAVKVGVEVGRTRGSSGPAGQSRTISSTQLVQWVDHLGSPVPVPPDHLHVSQQRRIRIPAKTGETGCPILCSNTNRFSSSSFESALHKPSGCTNASSGTHSPEARTSLALCNQKSHRRGTPVCLSGNEGRALRSIAGEGSYWSRRVTSPFAHAVSL